MRRLAVLTLMLVIVPATAEAGDEMARYALTPGQVLVAAVRRGGEDIDIDVDTCLEPGDEALVLGSVELLLERNPFWKPRLEAAGLGGGLKSLEDLEQMQTIGGTQDTPAVGNGTAGDGTAGNGMLANGGGGEAGSLLILLTVTGLGFLARRRAVRLLASRGSTCERLR